ncbi:organic cation transporter protein-like [Leguminivora glycinivorella]|uniref:organic cation transporter protein-like n=1 Tax=Leguminivora glycinivorella TaxID=1035111 RepID=UPI00200CBF7F|nr:organic cation transporter protein-like [Leguminivora glycinivorella]
MEEKNQASDVKVEEAEVRTRIDLDKILVDEIGQFGWFQLRTWALAALAVMFGGFCTSEYVFTTARINTRCLIPECESTDQTIEFAPSWILNAVPASGSSFDSCQRFANVSINSFNDVCPASLFDSTSVVDCEEYVYENTDTVVYTFGLACRDWQRSFMGTARALGTLICLPLTGFVSDRWGRRTALIINAVILPSLGLSRSWTNTYVGFTLLEFLEAALGGGVFTCAYIIVMEMVGPRMRVAFGTSMNSFFSVGCVIAGLLAWAFNDWRVLTRVLYIPMFIMSFSLWFVPESVRWYMSEGRYQESETVLKAAARMNRKQLSDKSLEALRESVEEEKRKNEMEKQTKTKEPWLIVQVFRHKQILIRCLISPIWWVTFTIVYYGLSINVVNMSGNRYLNFVAVSAVEVPGYWTSMFLLGIIGRKPVLITAFWVCAACQAAYIFMPDGYYELSLTVYLIGKFSIAMVAAGLYVYTAELYPTRNRHSLLGYSSMVGRIGSILAPLTPAMGNATFDELPFVIFGCFALVSGCLVFITPETLGAKFPDTMEEASDIGKKKYGDK